MIPFSKNPGESIKVTYDGTKKLVVSGTPAEVYQSNPHADLVAGSDGALTVGAASINAAVVNGVGTDAPVPIGQGITAQVTGGTPGQVYFVDFYGTTNAGNIRGDRVQITVNY